MARRPGTDKLARRLHDLPGKHDSNDTRASGYSADAVKPAKIDASLVQPPKWMNDKQKEAFLHMRNSVSFIDVAAISDTHALEILCQVYTSYIDLNEQIAQDGLTVVSYHHKTGEEIIKPHPLLGERNRMFTSLRGLLIEFGMTPNSRRTVMKRDVTTPDTSEEEKWDDLLN